MAGTDIPAKIELFRCVKLPFYNPSPKKYEFIDPEIKFHPTIIEKHIGNAVPVRLGRVIARSIKAHLKKSYKISTVSKEIKKKQ